VPTKTRAAMNDGELTGHLVEAILGWKPTLSRFMKPGRGWSPRSHFQPLVKVADAFRLLIAADKFSFTGAGDVFAAEVKIGARLGKASGHSPARTITIAVARALGMEV
jgi:hypothetical protein